MVIPPCPCNIADFAKHYDTEGNKSQFPVLKYSERKLQPCTIAELAENVQHWLQECFLTYSTYVWNHISVANIWYYWSILFLIRSTFSANI